MSWAQKLDQSNSQMNNLWTVSTDSLKRSDSRINKTQTSLMYTNTKHMALWEMDKLMCCVYDAILLFSLYRNDRFR